MEINYKFDFDVGEEIWISSIYISQESKTCDCCGGIDKNFKPKKYADIEIEKVAVIGGRLCIGVEEQPIGQEDWLEHSPTYVVKYKNGDIDTINEYIDLTSSLIRKFFKTEEEARDFAEEKSEEIILKNGDYSERISDKI